MELKKFLEENPIITKKELAKLMYPVNKSAFSKLSNKLEEREVGSGKQRMLAHDVEASVKALESVRDSIDHYIKENKK